MAKEESEAAVKLITILCDDSQDKSQKIEKLFKKSECSLHWNARGETTLHVAVMMGMSVCFDKLLKNLIFYEGPDVVNNHNDLGYTALHLAAEENKHEHVRLLLKRNADVRNVTTNGASRETALHLAARSKALQCMKLLVESPNIDINAVNDLKETALHIAVASKTSDSLKCVQLLLDHQCDVNLKDKNSFTAFHTAAVTGSAEILQLLIKHRALPHERTKRKWTALHLAAYKNNHNVIRTLLEKECNICATTDCGQTALHLAVKIRHDMMETVDQIIKHDKDRTKQTSKLKMINLKDNQGRTALHIAMEHKNIKCVKALVDSGADIGIKDSGNWTPLHYAAKYNCLEAIPVLIREREYDSEEEINASDEKSGLTALHLAVQKGYFQFIRDLIEKNPDINVRDKEGRTPLYLAISMKQRDCVDALLNVDKVDVSAVTIHGMSAVHEAVLVNNIEGLKRLLKNRPVEVKEKLCNAKAKDGWTPLHIAAIKNHPKCIIHLLKNGGAVSAKLESNFTPLDLAKQYKHSDCILLLEPHDGEAVNESHPENRQKFISLVHEVKKANLWQGFGSRVAKDPSTTLTDSGKTLQQEISSPTAKPQPQKPQENQCSKWLQNPTIEDDDDGETGLHKEARLGHADHVKQILDKHSELAFLNRKSEKNKTALLIAAEGGHCNVITALLDACGSVIECKDEDNSTALHLATRGGHLDCVTKLLNTAAGLNKNQFINIQNDAAQTALDLAVENNHTDCVQILFGNEYLNLDNFNKFRAVCNAIEMGNDGCFKLLLEKVHLDDEPKQMVKLLFLAVKKGNHECIKMLLEQYSASIYSRKEDLKEALEAACMIGHVECLLLLLKELPNERLRILHIAAKTGQDAVLKAMLHENQEDINGKGDKEITALHIASRFGYEECVKILLANNANIVLRDKNGLTALHYSAKAGKLACLEILLNHDDIKTISTTTDKLDLTVLHHAAKKGHDDCLIALLNEADIRSIVNNADTTGLTALHYAAREGHTKCIKTLLYNGADKNSKDEKDATPVHMAAREDKVDCLDILMEHKADMGSKTKEGWTALHYSAKSGHNLSVVKLLEAKVNPNGRTAKYFTPLRFAAANGHKECVKALLSCSTIKVNMKCDKNMTALHVAAWNDNVEIVEMLLKAGADPGLKDEYYCIPLHRAAMKDCHLSIAKLLEWKDAKDLIDAKDVKGNTALWMAANRKHGKSLQLLVNCGADVNFRSEDESKNTALHEVVGFNNIECAKILVEGKAILTVKNAAGQTPIEYARQRGFKDLRTMLLKYKT